MILRADARFMPIADQSVNCVVTSPPYWGLRDYGLDPSVWGGDDGCEHDFTGVIHHEHRAQGSHGKSRTTERFYGGDPSRRFNEDHQRHFTTHFCKCGAWRGSLGLEPTLELYVQHIVEIFREVRRVLRKDGTLWLNLGFSWDGKGNVVDQPGTVKDVLVADGWFCKAPIIWHKPNCMPSSQTKRPTMDFEMVYLFARDQGTKYYFAQDAVKEPVTGNAHARGDGVNPKAADWPKGWDGSKGKGGHGSIHREGRERHDSIQSRKTRAKVGHKSNPDSMRNGIRPKQNASFSAAVKDLVEYRNIRSVWTIATQPFSGCHFATFPEKLVEPCIKAGCPEGGIVLDPFAGSGVTGRVATRLRRKSILLDLKYHDLSEKRNSDVQIELPEGNECATTA